ncbi:hypothetical protein L1049_011862 [Liquidambar formosana]|uniref:Uncharacterized protein n=1 Tax=Liquidambar formosana TaxID=63359 RepID=A0AAP0WYD8_LIQFO
MVREESGLRFSFPPKHAPRQINQVHSQLGSDDNLSRGTPSAQCDDVGTKEGLEAPFLEVVDVAQCSKGSARSSGEEIQREDEAGKNVDLVSDSLSGDGFIDSLISVVPDSYCNQSLVLIDKGRMSSKLGGHSCGLDMSKGDFFVDMFGDEEVERVCNSRDFRPSKSKKGKVEGRIKRNKATKARRGRRNILKEKLKRKDVPPKDLMDLHGSRISVPNSGIVNRNRILLEQANNTWELCQKIGIRCLGNEEEVIDRLIELGSRDWVQFEKYQEEV